MANQPPTQADCRSASTRDRWQSAQYSMRTRSSLHVHLLVVLVSLLAFTAHISVARASDNHVLLDRLQEVLDSPASRIGARCRNDTLFYLDRLRNGSPWALKSE
ncbi:hypothetical protein HPB49_004036 [Dermacentor silvarum]|uniref:Uncharacterized protein n=1 Tax=Dermacentor silvarum TaxID=543639 RepID=A0ACB8DUJ8_DERSI|nr:hypothetical protein HPB49_004036 [Dermacentor silvarum]